jgi:hypothetical protein
MKMIVRSGYQITVEERDARLDEQGHRCAVCRRPFRLPKWHLKCTFKGKLVGRRIGPASVDHDHVSGDIRGLLCPWCNRTVVDLVEKHPITVSAAQRYFRNGGWTTD